MPFTLAHPAAVVFMKNKYLDLWGLILGAMAPDFIYFILFNPSSNLGHTFIGFIILNLPICFLLNYLINKYIKDAFIINLPEFISKYYIYLLRHKNNIKNINEAIVFIYSCMIGMLTDVIWDGFTHKTEYFVIKLSFLRNKIDILGIQIPIFKIIQHGSTVLGFIIIFFYLYKIRKLNNKFKAKSRSKLIYHVIAIFIQILTIFCSHIIFEKFGVGRLVVTFINGLFIGYLISSIIYKYNSKNFSII
jgi:hypothetical protein